MSNAALLSSKGSTSLSKAQTYLNHLSATVSPALSKTCKDISGIDVDIADYQQVASRVRATGTEERYQKRATITDLGADVYVNVIVPNIATICLDLGLNIHLEMPAEDAAAYCDKYVEILQRKRERLVSKKRNLEWEVEQFQGAIKELNERST